MRLPRGIGKILAPIFALIAVFFAVIELSQALNKIKMVLDAIIFISDTYNSAAMAWSGFILWKGNVTYQISHPIYNAFPILDLVPGIVWNIIIGLICIYVALWILNRI